MKNWTLRKLLGVGFTAPVAVIVVLFVFVFRGLNRIQEHSDAIATDNIPGLVASGDVTRASLSYRGAVLRHLLARTTEDETRFDGIVQRMEGEVKTAFDAYERSIHLAEDRKLFQESVAAWAAYVEFGTNVRKLKSAGKFDEAIQLVETEGTQRMALVQQTFDQLVAFNTGFAARSGVSISSAMSQTRVTVTSLTLAAIGLSIAAGFFITRQVNRTIRRVSNALDDTSAQVTAAAGQVSGASQSLAQGASEQAASLEETSASIEELASMTKRNADSAQQTKELSNQTRIAADTCAADMQAMNVAMDEIKTSSSDISKIIKTIDEIAFQTNILALNAAVEAARAGDAGMGFAVVAEEVRSLAQRSAQSAKETAAKIEVAISKSEHGVRISGKVAESLAQILDKARKVDTLVAEIATASHEQNQGIGQVNTTVSQMDKVTQSNAGNAEETAAAAEELSAQAVAMQEVVADLRRLIEGGEIPAAPAAEVRPPRVAKSAAPAPLPATPGTLQRPKLHGRDSAAAQPADDLHFADVEPTANGHARTR